MKICEFENCNYRVFAKGYCRSHQHARPDFKHSQLKRTPVKKQSDKERVRLQHYRKAKNEFMKTHPICEAGLPGCLYWADQIHHKKGKVGDLLTDTAHFLAVCGICHTQIESDPKTAKELNLSSSRLNKAS